MSSRSPRGSPSGLSSADVAADFEDSLKDLQGNNRYEISNLTVIAKENTEHAEAISNTLEAHIKNVRIIDIRFTVLLKSIYADVILSA
jgi:pre-mRNA cleavage complex 2 protein Pcf11